MSQTTTDTRYISALRFPLALLVVFIHCKMYAAELEKVGSGAPAVLTAAVRVCSQIVPTFAVPLFFAISGYLFFLHMKQFTLSAYVAKLRRRVFTLLIPYVVWVLVSFVLYQLKAKMTGAPSGFEFGWQLFWGVRQLGPGGTNWLGYVLEPTLAPVLEPFWFVRDLICIVILSPFVYFLVKRCGIVGLLCLAVAHYGHLWPNFGHVSLTGLWCFSLGAWFSLHGTDPLQATRRLFRPSLYMLVPLVAVLFFCDGIEWVQATAQMLYGFAAMITALHLAQRYGTQSRMLSRLAATSFFIYASHTMLLSPLCMVMAKLTAQMATGLQLLTYFALPLVCVPMCLAVYWLVHRFMPLGWVLTAEWGKRKQ